MRASSTSSASSDLPTVLENAGRGGGVAMCQNRSVLVQKTVEVTEAMEVVGECRVQFADPLRCILLQLSVASHLERCASRHLTRCLDGPPRVRSSIVRGGIIESTLHLLQHANTAPAPGATSRGPKGQSLLSTSQRVACESCPAFRLQGGRSSSWTVMATECCSE